MPKVTWTFRIGYNKSYPTTGAYCDGVLAGSAKEVEEIAGAAGFALTTSYECERLGSVRTLRVNEPEDSERLHILLAEIWKRYSIKPAEWYPIPTDKRQDYFGVRKFRTYSKRELDKADYLYLSAFNREIAEWQKGEPSDIENERYVVEKGSVKKTVKFGHISPFPPIAISTELKEALENCKLIGLETEPVFNGEKQIWKLTSSILLPYSTLRYVNDDGQSVDRDSWPVEQAFRILDSGAYDPIELTFQRETFEAMGDFDIAVTRERQGSRKAAASRYIVVSQKFRQNLKEHKLRGLVFSPVRLA